MKKLLPKTLKNPNGFTLIELLVVISIIAFLSVIGIVAFGQAQKQARDGRRRADIDAIANALESNRDAISGKYKPSGLSIASKTGLNDNFDTYFSTGKAPEDPGEDDTYYYHVVITDTDTKYSACAKLEIADSGNADNQTAQNIGTTTGDFYCKKNQQ